MQYTKELLERLESERSVYSDAWWGNSSRTISTITFSSYQDSTCSTVPPRQWITVDYSGTEDGTISITS